MINGIQRQKRILDELSVQLESKSRTRARESRKRIVRESSNAFIDWTRPAPVKPEGPVSASPL